MAIKKKRRCTIEKVEIMILPYSLFSVPYSLFPIPCSLLSTKLHLDLISQTFVTLAIVSVATFGITYL